MTEKIKVALGTTMLILFLAAGVFGILSDSARKEDALYAKKQLDVSLERSLSEIEKRSAQSKGEHETLAKFLFGVARQSENAHITTHKKLDKIESLLCKREEEVSALRKQAKDALAIINTAPADSEDYRKALHSASDWAKDYRQVTGMPVTAPKAQAGGKAVAEFYATHLHGLE